MEYGLIGYPLGHSHSPFVHSFFGYSYELKEVKGEDLPNFFNEGAFSGLNVTIPHKTTVIPFLDELDESAKKCGAVNTIVKREGKLFGYNTDIFGMAYALNAAGISLKNKNVVILGTGGTSLMAQTLAKEAGARSITVVSRSGDRNYENVYDLTDTEVIVNCTPVGMFPHNGGKTVDLSRFPALSGVFDAVYNPLKSALVLDAEEKKIPCAGGLKMLVAQGKRAAEIFTGKDFDDDVIEKIARKLQKKLTNIVLVGMPGCGKTTVGKRVAELLNRDFIDTDAEIERMENRSIPEIFATDGEGYFRALEKKTIAESTKRQGVVLSTGGGAVLDFDNVRNMRQNGLVIRIERDIDALSREGRPLSKDRDALKKLAETREPFYRLADASFANDMPLSCAKKIVEYFGKQ